MLYRLQALVDVSQVRARAEALEAKVLLVPMPRAG
jgi:hypothetical protein